jgi:hypothetical protein
MKKFILVKGKADLRKDILSTSNSFLTKGRFTSHKVTGPFAIKDASITSCFLLSKKSVSPMNHPCTNNK